MFRPSPIRLHLTPEQKARHREHVRKGLIHLALILFTIDAAGAMLLVHYLHNSELFFSDCGKSGAVLATISCYLE